MKMIWFRHKLAHFEHKLAHHYINAAESPWAELAILDLSKSPLDCIGE